MGSRPRLTRHVSYEQNSKSAILSPGIGYQLKVFAVHLVNQAAVANDMGVLIRLAPSNIKFGTFPTPGPLVDVTAALQTGTPENIFDTTLGNGFVVQSHKAFGLIGFHVTQAQGAGAPTYSYSYYNGVAYVPLPYIIDTPDYSTIGDKIIVFPAPRDWVPGSTLAVGGDADKYSILAVSTLAPVQAVIADDIWMGSFLHYQPQIPAAGILSVVYDSTFPNLLDGLEGILPYFKVADVKNLVTAEFFPQG